MIWKWQKGPELTFLFAMRTTREPGKKIMAARSAPLRSDTAKEARCHGSLLTRRGENHAALVKLPLSKKHSVGNSPQRQLNIRENDFSYADNLPGWGICLRQYSQAGNFGSAYPLPLFLLKVILCRSIIRLRVLRSTASTREAACLFPPVFPNTRAT